MCLQKKKEKTTKNLLLWFWLIFIIRIHPIRELITYAALAVELHSRVISNVGKDEQLLVWREEGFNEGIEELKHVDKYRDEVDPRQSAYELLLRCNVQMKTSI